MNEHSQSEIWAARFGRVAAADRGRRRPTPRNLRIADEVRVSGRTQSEVGAEYGLSQRRISQICQQVDAYYSQTQAWQRGEPCGPTYEESENELARRRLTEIYRRAMRAHARSEQPLATRRTRTCGGEEQWTENAERDQRQDTGSLRVALRAIEQSSKLAKRGEPQEGNKPEHREWYLTWVIQSLVRLRREAAWRGDVPCGGEQPIERVERLVRELVGSEAPVDASGASAAAQSLATAGPVVDESAASGQTPTSAEETDASPPAAWPNAEPHVAHPNESSSTSAPLAVEAGAVADAQAQPVSEDDVANGVGPWSYDAALAPAVAGPVTESDEQPADGKIASRSPAKKSAGRPAESPEDVLAALTRAYGMAVSWEMADDELREFLLARSSGPGWSYSAEQRSALLAWRRASRGGRTSRTMPSGARID